MEETLSAFMEPLKGLAKPTKAPTKTSNELLTEYVLADLHAGMYAWAAEAGDDYDSNIASELACQATDRLVSASPNSANAVINNLGDFYHLDSSKNETAAGTRVDVDTRYRKVVNAGIRTLRHIVLSALKKHEHVRIRNTPGNHDTHSSLILDAAMTAYFENEPRVTVEDDPRAFWAYRFGSNLVGTSHGHAPKPKLLPGLLACDYPKWWAECEFKYCRHGHLHHCTADEEMGVIVEGFRTLAAKDAWHAGMGYRSGRDMKSIVLHDQFGEVERHTASLRALEQANKI